MRVCIFVLVLTLMTPSFIYPEVKEVELKGVPSVLSVPINSDVCFGFTVRILRDKRNKHVRVGLFETDEEGLANITDGPIQGSEKSLDGESERIENDFKTCILWPGYFLLRATVLRDDGTAVHDSRKINAQ